MENFKGTLRSLLLPALLILAVIVLIPIGITLLRGASDPAAPEESGQIVTSTEQQDVSNLTPSPEAFDQPAGLSLVYGETDPSGTRTTLWMAPIDDPDKRQSLGVVEHRMGYPPTGSISPDGLFLAYLRVPPEATESSARTNGGEVWTLNLVGTGQHRLAGQAGFVAAWSPDSRSLVYGARIPLDQPQDPKIAFRTDFIEMDVDGSNPEILISSAQAYGIQPLGWAADGNRFFAAELNSKSEWNLIAWDQKNRTVEQVAALSKDGLVRSFTLSPTGDRLLLDVVVEGREELVLHELANGRKQTLAELPADAPEGARLSALWSADGKQLLTNNPGEERSQRMQKFDLNGLEAVAVPAPGGNENPQLIPLRWSPDGAWIVLRDYADPTLPIYIQKVGEENLSELPRSGTEYHLTFYGWVTR